MVAKRVKARLSQTEKRAELQAAYERQGRKCYICFKSVNLDATDNQMGPDLHENPTLEHVESKFLKGAEAEQSLNYAVSHRRCNRKKGTMGLDLARAIVWLDDVRDHHTEATLGDVQLDRHMELKQVRVIERQVNGQDVIDLEFDGGSKVTAPIFEDDRLPAARYFYARVPIGYIHHDAALQARPLGDQIDRFIRFMHRQPMLDVGHARLHTNEDGYGNILLWNGQHRVVVALLTGRPAIDLKIYVNPADQDVKTLRFANADAHGHLRQVGSPAPNSAERYAVIFGDAWDDFMANPAYARKSEAAFIESQPDAERKKQFTTILRNKRIVDSVLRAHEDKTFEDPNKAKDYTDYVNTRSARMLFTYNSIQNSFVKTFANLQPLDVDLSVTDPDDDPRFIERGNIVRLLNMLIEEAVEKSWDRSRGAKPVGSPDFSAHDRAVLITRPVAMEVWTAVLRDSIVKACAIAGDSLPATQENAATKKMLVELNEDTVFLSRLPEEIWTRVRKMVAKLVKHQMWNNPHELVRRTVLENSPATAKPLILEGKVGDQKLYREPVTISYLL